MAYISPILANNTAAQAALRYQSSPLSPLTTPVSGSPTALPTILPSLAGVATGSPVSLVLVTLLLIGIVAVIGLVFWRQR